MIKFIFKNKLLATTAICAISMCANTVKAEEINILDILNNSTTKSPNIIWEKVDTTGTDTIQIGDEYFKYTYTQPTDYTEVKDLTEEISVIDPTETETYKYVGSAINNPSGTDYGDIEKYVFSNNKVTATLENNTDDWKYIYVYGGAISNQGTIGDITSDFLNNFTEVSVTGDHAYSSANGGAILNYGTISSITGDFISNSATGSYSANGGAIYNYEATIGNIIGNFIENSATSTDEDPFAFGGAIYNYSNSTISSITGDFVDNNATGSYSANGGAIYNYGTISSITGDFTNNSAISTNYTANGGAIYNSGGGSVIEYITGDFVGNSATATYSSANGGAILNYGTISSITGDFISNSAIGSYSANGGAIYNEATIGNITGNFIDNSATSTNGTANGGAIYNSGTIESITGNFTDNSATSTNGTANGGAISNWGTIELISGDFIGNSATSTNGTAKGGAIYHLAKISLYPGGSVSVGDDISIAVSAYNDDILIKDNYVEDKDGKRYEAIYNAIEVRSGCGGCLSQETIDQWIVDNPDIVKNSVSSKITFDAKSNGSFTFYDFINSDGTGSTDFTGDGTGTFNLYNNIQNQKDINFQNKYVMNMISPDDIHSDASKYSYIQAQNININAALQMMLDVDLENAEMDRFEADNFTISATGSIDVTKFNIVTDVTGDIGTTTEVEFIVSDNATGLENITNVTEAVGEVYTYFVTFNPETGAFEFVSTGLAPEPEPEPKPVEPSAPAPEEVAPNQAPSLTTNTTVAAVETVVAQIFERDVTISTDINYGSDTPYSSERVSEEATSDGVNIHNNKSVWVKTFGSDDDLELDNFNGTIDSEAYGVVGGVDSKVFTYDNGVKAAYGIYGAYVGGKQKYDDNKIEQKSGYLGVSAAFRKNNLFSNFTLNGGYITSEANTELGKDEFDTKVVSVANKTGVDIKAGNNWTFTPAMYVAYTGMDTEDYTNKAGVKMENEFANVVTLAPEVKVRKGFNNGVGAYAKASYKHYIYDAEVRADDVLLEEMSAKPYVEYGFGVEKNWADKSGYAEITRRDGGREGWNVNLGLNLDF